MLDKFSDLRFPIEKYLQYKEKVRILECYIRSSIKSRVENSKNEELIDLLVHLISISKTEEEAKSEEKYKEMERRFDAKMQKESEIRESRETSTSSKLLGKDNKI